MLGLLAGRRGIESIGWSVVRMGQVGSSFAQFATLIQKSIALLFQRERVSLLVGIPWLRELGVIPLGGLQGPKGSEDLLRTKGGSKV